MVTITFVVAEITFNVAVINSFLQWPRSLSSGCHQFIGGQDSLVVAEITFKMVVITSSVVKSIFVVTEITFVVVAITFRVTVIISWVAKVTFVLA